jgi:hypothetical protein
MFAKIISIFARLVKDICDLILNSMTTKKVYYDFFVENRLVPFYRNNQHLDKALLAQSLLFVGFYHRLKYLHNLQSHPVYLRKF